MDITIMLQQIQRKGQIDSSALAQILGTSFVSIERWTRGAAKPSPAQMNRIRELYDSGTKASWPGAGTPNLNRFAARGARHNLPLFAPLLPKVALSVTPFPPILDRLKEGAFFRASEPVNLATLLSRHTHPATTANTPPKGGMSAGKNTYTYDAHTYHTKVPPQGIAELLAHYLPEGGLVLDPFAGSGMTGVAARVLGYDCILNELSPAACFIANQFITVIDADLFQAGVNAILEETREIRHRLYTTICRECGKRTEIQYTVWSYCVICPHCKEEFRLWDYCRQYGEIVKEHKILSEFPCPNCKIILKKSTLQRTYSLPILLGYKCCGSKQQEMTHPLTQEDLELIRTIEINTPLADGFFPRTRLYDGVNLRQPIKHCLDSIEKFYTPRNIAAMSHLWRAIHRIEQVELAAFLAFVFTSLYQRVTRLSEFRFWGGSGNTARFNVPYIFNEANVFLTFSRKARSIQDHLQTTARSYSGNTVVVNGSATSLDYLPDNTIDLIFTDPPFGANINYSEMNILWESWLGAFTDTTNEAVINKFQGKDIEKYRELMLKSLSECYRVLRPGGWLLLMFMNSSKDVWNALRSAMVESGFHICKIDMFDKQHGTFKQFVSDNTTGFDLVIHCQKLHHSNLNINRSKQKREDLEKDIYSFMASKGGEFPVNAYIHVEREEEIDFRQLYSDWLSKILPETGDIIDFSDFRALVRNYLARSARRD